MGMRFWWMGLRLMTIYVESFRGNGVVSEAIVGLYVHTSCHDMNKAAPYFDR
jgi:hypothetical protein